MLCVQHRGLYVVHWFLYLRASEGCPVKSSGPLCTDVYITEVQTNKDLWIKYSRDNSSNTQRNPPFVSKVVGSIKVGRCFGSDDLMWTLLQVERSCPASKPGPPRAASLHVFLRFFPAVVIKIARWRELVKPGPGWFQGPHLFPVLPRGEDYSVPSALGTKAQLL